MELAKQSAFEQRLQIAPTIENAMHHDVPAPDFVNHVIRLEVNFEVVSNTNAHELLGDMTSKGKLGECVAQRFELVDDIQAFFYGVMRCDVGIYVEKVVFGALDHPYSGAFQSSRSLICFRTLAKADLTGLLRPSWRLFEL